MLFKLLVFFMSACFALANEGCTPDQWHGYTYSLTSFANRDHHFLRVEHAELHYDFTNRRSAVFLHRRDGRVHTVYQIVTLYEESDNATGRLYVANLLENSCWTTKLTTPFMEYCIPDDARHYNNYYLGMMGEFLVSSFGMSRGHMDTEFGVLFHGSDMYPVDEKHTGYDGTYDVFQEVDYYNITAGPSNSSTFEVPADCQFTDDGSLYHHLTHFRIHY